jgi:general secretion pathway protein D
MKILERPMLTALAAVWITAVGSAPAHANSVRQATPQEGLPAQAVEAQDTIGAPAANNLLLTAGAADKGRALNLRGVPVDEVLQYLCEAEGFTIIRECSTEMQGTVDVVSATPLSKEETVSLLIKVLAQRGLTALQDGRTLTIMTVEDAARLNQTPVLVWNNEAASIPRDARLVTEVLALHSLSATQVAKDLSTLLPPEAGLVANEGANAVIMTASQADIRRFAQIIQALDSSGGSDLELFPLEHADAKAIAQELKDVFAAQDAGAGQANAFQNLAGNRGGGGTGNSRRAAIRVNTVSDDANNTVLVSAPPDVMAGISNLIHSLDIQAYDVLQFQVFSLLHADPTDVAAQIASLFPGTATQAGAQNNGRGPGAQFVSASPAATSGDGLSSRAKKQATVIAVPDPRTKSVLITASKDTMAQIGNIIGELDANAAGAMNIYIYRPEYTDVPDLRGPLSDLFPSMTQTATGSAVNVLAQRANQAAQSASTTATGAISSGGGSSGSRSSQQ